MDNGIEQIEDESLVAQLRDKAKRINVRALITAAATTLLALVFP